MIRRNSILFLFLSLLSLRAAPPELRTGVAEYAFDHLGSFSNLAGPATASGVSIIYCSGFGQGYLPLPDEKELAAAQQQSRDYLKQARARGIRLAIGYVCATSIVKLPEFDRNWTPKFRTLFHSPPAEWRQLDQNGVVLTSWYGAPYEAACMNNPDWRRYERFVVEAQLKSGCDGIFFDNPTVHPKGCYCPYCMEKFHDFLSAKRINNLPEKKSVGALRAWAIAHPVEFMDFRATIASDFLADMRSYARSIKPGALLTCNNSLNAPDALFSQCRADGYDIERSSQVEDLLTIEDMQTEARTVSGGRVFEYGPTYQQLHAISHGKPIVACTLADADYFHTSANIARLSMAEAAANDASWLLWPVWPEKVSAAILPEAELLRANEKLLNHTEPRYDVLLFLPFRRWLETGHCAASDLAAGLGRSGFQYGVASEESLATDLVKKRMRFPVLLVESRSVFNDRERRAVAAFQGKGGQVVAADDGDWMGVMRNLVNKPSVVLNGPSTLRAVVRDQPSRAIVHLYNLNVNHLAAFDDQVHPAEQIGLTLRVPFKHVRSVKALSADTGSTAGSLDYLAQSEDGETVVRLTYPKLEVSTIIVIEP